MKAILGNGQTGFRKVFIVVFLKILPKQTYSINKAGAVCDHIVILCFEGHMMGP
jgi:hypothetical protein